VYYATRMPRRGKSKKPPVRTGDAFVRLLLPSGVPVLMCFCGDPCKVAKYEEEETNNQRYWISENYAFDPTSHQIRIRFLLRMYIFVAILLMSYFQMYTSCVTIECFADPSHTLCID